MNAIHSPSPPKQKLLEIDIVRSIAILAVVMIHATSEGTVRLPEGGTAQRIFVLLNSLPHFSVPAFLFVSGLVLAYRYADRWHARDSLTFFRKRLVRSVIPFLIWSAFYYIWNSWVNDRPLTLPSGEVLRSLLLRGSASYHLYFLVLIVQFYVLFPLLMSAAKVSPWFRKNMIVFGIAGQAVYYAFCRHYAPDAYASEVSLTYLAHFVTGCWIGLHYDAFAARTATWVRTIVPLAVVAGLVYGIMAIHRRYLPSDWDPGVYVLAVHVYSLLAAIALTAVARALITANASWYKPLLALGSASFGIYLLHPAFLQLFARIWEIPITVHSFVWYTAFAFMFCLLASWLLERLYRFIRKKIFLRA